MNKINRDHSVYLFTEHGMVAGAGKKVKVLHQGIQLSQEMEFPRKDID
jgi:hypothetical protein